MAAGAAAAGAPTAAADPADLVPYCSGDQTPMDSYCRPSPSQEFTHDSPGADPQVGIGPSPDDDPAV
jgi:hypothetical protein